MGVERLAPYRPDAHRRWTVILDDAVARRCARSFGLRLKGTLAVIILARQRGLISSLLNIGFRLDENVIRDALSRTVGERWE